MSIQLRSNLLMLLFILSGLNCKIKAVDHNLAKYRIVYHSSSIDQNKSGHLVVDGSRETFWESERGNPQSLTIYLGSVQKINKIVIHWGTNYATEFKITLLDKEKEKGVFSNYRITDGLTSINCQGSDAGIVRLDITGVVDTANGCTIREVQIFGDFQERFIPSSATSLSMENLSLNGNTWRVQNSMFIKDKPETISAINFDDSEWIPAKVPGTIMSSYYDFGALPDPFFGDNMHQISDEFFSGNDFWYRVAVNLPLQKKGKQVFLNFSGINWKADVYFNSSYLGRIDGAYQRAEFDVTGLISASGSNTVAVLIHHLDNWISGERKVKRKYLGSPTRNGDNLGLDSPAILASAGWNWLPIVRGRNTGIWNDVCFIVREKVSIIDPWVSSTIPLPDTSTADLTIRTELRNHSRLAVEGKLVARFGNVKIEYPVKLNGNELKSISLDKSQFNQLSIKNPMLWWPNGYGAQNLHNLSLQFVNGVEVYDKKEINFGIRQIDTKVVENILFFYCNGQRILLRGGNWGLPEGMIRCDSAGYDLRVKLHKDANLNMIRNWVGMTGHEAFYDACDRYGLMIWDDFWLANPVDGPDPKDNALFMSNVRDKIKWVRSHPSLVLYCGRNEGYPPRELDSAMKMETRLLDGTRHYIPHSSAGTVTGLGPYDLREPVWYFANKGVTLHSELGIVAFPEVETMRRMMPAEYLWPVNDMWAIHDYQWGRSEKFTARIEARYGKPEGVEDYSKRAQFLNYETARAMFECLQSNQGSGVLLWMSQSAWPSMICQLYDHYFEYTSAFFAVKKACQPVHILWDVLKNDIRIANNTNTDLKDITARAVIYDSNGKIIWEKTGTTDVTSSSSKSCFDLNHLSGEKVHYLKLELTAKGRIVDENFYWLENKEGNCLDINDLPLTNVIVNHKMVAGKNGTYSAKITVKNTSSVLSLMNKVKIKDKSTGESILPVFLSDDYISLLPGEEKVIILNIEDKLFKNRVPEIWLDGWNTKTVKIDLM